VQLVNAARVFPILKSVKSVFIRGKGFAFSWDFSASRGEMPAFPDLGALAFHF
jgi:hypothetical protein